MKKIVTANIVEGPLYEEMGEDEMGFWYDYFIEVTDEDGSLWTHKRSFRWNETMEREKFFKRVMDSNTFNPEYWYEGEVWAYYKTPQSYEEEKRDALAFEAHPPAYLP